MFHSDHEQCPAIDMVLLGSPCASLQIWVTGMMLFKNTFLHVPSKKLVNLMFVL